MCRMPCMNNNFEIRTFKHCVIQMWRNVDWNRPWNVWNNSEDLELLLDPNGLIEGLLQQMACSMLFSMCSMKLPSELHASHPERETVTWCSKNAANKEDSRIVQKEALYEKLKELNVSRVSARRNWTSYVHSIATGPSGQRRPVLIPTWPDLTWIGTIEWQSDRFCMFARRQPGVACMHPLIVFASCRNGELLRS